MKTSERLIDYYQLVENALTGFMIVTDKEVIYANCYIYHLLEYEKGEELHCSTIIHPDDQNVFSSSLRMVFELKRSIYPLTIKVLKKKGGIVPVGVSFKPYEIDSCVYAHIHIHDLGMEEANDHYYSLVTENTSELIAEVGDDGTLHYVSPSVTHLLKYDPHEVMGTNHFDYIHPEDIHIVEESQKNLLTTRKTTQLVRYRIRSKDNHYIWVESKANIVLYNNGEHRIVVATRDVTGKVEAENMLLQSEKLALIGELSAGVVHEIKNPLTSIKGFLQLMQEGTIQVKDYINILNSEIERIEKIAEDLLGFAKPKKDEFKSVDIREAIEEVHNLLNGQTNTNQITISSKTPNEQLFTWGEKSQIKQVLLNLIKNAVEACDIGGTIEIELHSTEQEVIITVTDDGCGMSEEQLEKIGTSFFTSKEKGTGLGLMVSQKILSNHNGTLLVDSQLNVGTTFTIKLPVYKK